MLLYSLALVIGVTLGALGSGGAILLLPALLYVGKLPMQTAVATSMAAIVAVSLAGAVVYLRRGMFSARLAVVFGLAGIAGAFAGSTFTRMVPASVLIFLLSGVLVFVGVRMLSGAQALYCPNPCLPPRCAVIAFGIGLLTGFLGVGGGFLIVPALMRFAGLDQRSAAGTSLALITVNSLSGLVGQLRYVSPDWRLAGWLILFLLAGMAAGIAIAERLPSEFLRRVFAVMVIGIGVFVAITNFLGMRHETRTSGGVAQPQGLVQLASMEWPESHGSAGCHPHPR
jgi:uncharacterized membrane protein YfcA